MPVRRIRAVIDTNIGFEGLTRRGSAAGLIVDAWLADLFRACVSNSTAVEFVEKLTEDEDGERKGAFQ